MYPKMQSDAEGKASSSESTSYGAEKYETLILVLKSHLTNKKHNFRENHEIWLVWHRYKPVGKP